MKKTTKNETVIAVLSDIHGNYIALEKCIEYALDKGARQFIFLGDYVGELAYPQKTMEIIYLLQKQYKCYFIKGNKEDYWINYEKNGEKGWKKYNSTTGSLFYTYTNLTTKDKEFFKSLSISEDIYIDNFPSMTICHGSPYKVNEKMLTDDERTFEIMDKSKTSLILCGHTHVQQKIEHDGRMILNVGAVGVPLRSNGKSQFLLLKGINETWGYEFVSLDYDVEKTVQELDLSGLNEYAPYWTMVTKQLLSTGKISHGTVLNKAMLLCQQDRGECVWPDIPEKYWNMAVKEIFG